MIANCCFDVHDTGWIDMSPATQKRNRLVPWYIGLVVIVAAVSYVGYQMWMTRCAPVPISIGVLVVIPIVYLILMYLTLVSQE